MFLFVLLKSLSTANSVLLCWKQAKSKRRPKRTCRYSLINLQNGTFVDVFPNSLNFSAILIRGMIKITTTTPTCTSFDYNCKCNVKTAYKTELKIAAYPELTGLLAVEKLFAFFINGLLLASKVRVWSANLTCYVTCRFYWTMNKTKYGRTQTRT